MTIKQYDETKCWEIWETATHRFKIGEEALEKIKDSKKYPLNLRKKIQKSLKQIVDESSGEFWEESVNEIFTVITKNSMEGE